MLQQFKVSNYMSIRDEIVLSLSANYAIEHEGNNIVYGKDRIFPSLAIYGANAVGKSNIFKALTMAIMYVRNSQLMQINNPIQTIPFLLDDHSRNEPTKMDFVFIHNGKKFNYGFEVSTQKVLSEYLYEYVSSRPSMIFERTDDTYNFTTQNHNELEPLTEKNTSNKLFLCTATAWNSKLTKDAYLWFAEGIDTYDCKTFTDAQYLSFLDKEGDSPETKAFLLDLLKNTDFNITDYQFKSKPIDNINFMLPPGIKFEQSIIDQMKLNSKEYRLDAMHTVQDETGRDSTYVLDFSVESNGTKLMFAYAPIIHEALQKGRTIVVDELDNSLHPSLTKYIVKIFLDKNTNRNGAQLIFNSHDTDLLDSEMLRRDQVYFTEKEKNGRTVLHSLTEYKARRTDNFRKSYLDGKYGGLPEIKK